MGAINTIFLLVAHRSDEKLISVHKEQPEIPFDAHGAEIIEFRTTLTLEDFALDREPPIFKSRSDWIGLAKRINNSQKVGKRWESKAS